MLYDRDQWKSGGNFVMRKKYLIPSLFLASILASCNYGGIQVSTAKEFRDFYNSGDLKTQKDTPFDLGDDASVSYYYKDEDNNNVALDYTLSTSSISSWESEKKYGNKLEFLESKFVTDEEENVLEGLYNNGYLTYSSVLAKEESGETDESGDPVLVIVGKNNIYSSEHILNQQKTPEYTGENVDSSTRQNKTYTEFFESPDDGETFSDEVTTITRSLTVETHSVTITENSEKTQRTTTLMEVSNRVKYVENYELATMRKALSYLLDIRTTTTVEVKSGGVYEGSTRTVDSSTYSTSYDETKSTGAPKGNSTIVHTVFTYSEGEYHKDEQQSYKISDDEYRYEVTDEFIDSFAVEQLVQSFKIDPRLVESFFPSFNNFMKNLFTTFEGYMNDSSIGEEIIRFASTYQYRAKVNADTIYQYTFLKGEHGHDTMTSLVVFKVGNGGSLTEVSRANLIY